MNNGPLISGNYKYCSQYYFIFLAATLLLLFSCNKKSETKKEAELALNTWTFTQGSTVYKGTIFQPKSLIQKRVNSDGSHTFNATGPIENGNNIFEILLNLADTTFTRKDYISGISRTENQNHFVFMESINSSKMIYNSTDYAPGAKINYTISSFDKSRSVLTITFSGEAFDENKKKVKITDGKVTVNFIIL